MSANFFNGLYIIPILAVLILIHEIGHFVSARLCGVKVEEFGIGIPPRLFGWKRNGVIWSINAIPFGGFVRVLGEDGKNHDPGSMNTKSPAQRAFFLAAGSAMNVLLAIVLMIAVIGIQGIARSNVYVGGTAPGSPAAQAGWQRGDQIVEVAGDPLDSSEELISTTHEFAGKPMSVVIERRGQLVDTTIVPREDPPENEGRMGVGLDATFEADVFIRSVEEGSAAANAGLLPGDRVVSVNNRPTPDAAAVRYEFERFEGFAVPLQVERVGAVEDLTLEVPSFKSSDSVLDAIGVAARQAPLFEDVPAGEVLPRGFSESWQATTAMIAGIRELATNRERWGEVAGPVGMGQITSEVVSRSPLPLWVTLSNLAITLSLNLAVLNLLPLPALDGGRLLFVLIEVLRGGRKVAPEKEGVVHFVGLVLLLGLMFVIAFVDIDRLRDGRSFLP